MDEELLAVVQHVMSALPVSDNKLEEIRKETANDQTLTELKSVILKGWPTSNNQIPIRLKPYWKHRDELSIMDEIIFKERANDTKQVPNDPWQAVAKDLFTINNVNYLVAMDYYSKNFEDAKLDNTKNNTGKLHQIHFPRHGTPIEVRSDNGPQFTSSEYRRFSKEWNFKHTTISQSDGMAEITVQKSDLLRKAAKMEKIPISASWSTETHRLMTLLMSRRLRSIIPITQSHLKPKAINQETINGKLKEKQDRQKQYYDRNAKPLLSLNTGHTMKIQQQGKWEIAKVKGHAGKPRSYYIETPEGKAYRQNRRHLMKTNEKPPTQKSTIIDDEANVTKEHPSSTKQHPSIAMETTPAEKERPVNQKVTTTRSGRVVAKPEKYKDYVCN
ncbi:uncharacterized protein [Ptychodera flava]|uniref:uncharacterized protein n=1 Tax=Ptychodera flava TaxID=63121 RepID=UPI00396A66BA